MSDNTVEITESSNYTISIDTSLVQNDNDVTVETSSPNTVEIIDNNIILVSDLPYGYPLDWTTGNLPIVRVSGLDIIGGSGISVSDNSGIYTIAVTGSFGLTGEEVDDRVGSLLGAGSYINLNYNDNLDSLNISVTGLQPSGEYSVVGHSHGISDISGLQNALDSKQPSGIYASGVHYHNSNDIIDFNSSVSGLLPVKNISSGSGISVSNSSGDFTISVTGNFGLTSEQVDDRVNDLLKAGSYVNINYNDSLDSLTISVTGLQPSGNYSVEGHSHVIADVSGLQNVLDNKQPSGSYAPLVHSHSSSDITDFNSSVSGLIPPSNFTSLIGISGVIVTNSGTNYTVGLIDPTIQLTDITDLSIDARSFLSTPSSYNLQNLITNETGSGLLVFNDSPAFSGIPTVPTAPSGTNNSQIANTSFVRSEISNLVNSAPSTLDTLNELATALGNDPNFATTIASGLSQKSNIGHTHSSSDITNFNSSVSGLLPSVTGSGYVTSSFNSNLYTISVSGLQPSGNYANSVHTHNYGDIIDFASGIDNEVSTLLVAGSYINLNYDNVGDTLTISVTGVQPSGNYANSVHSHGNISSSGTIGIASGLLVTTTSGGALTTSSTINSSYISNFNSSVSGLLPVKNLSGSTYINVANSSGNYTISTTGLQPSGDYTLVGHTHGADDIYVNQDGHYFSEDYLFTVINQLDSAIFNHSHGNITSSGTIGSISGLLVTTSSSGLLTTSSSINSSYINDFNSSVSGLLPVKDIVAGTGIDVSSSGGIFTINSSNTISTDTLEPDGFVNRNDSVIAFNNTSRQFSISPKSPATSYAIYNNGTKVVKSSTEITTLPDTTALYFIHFDKSNNSLSYKTTGFDFDTDIPIAQIYYNTDDDKAVYFGEERHGIRMDASTHRYLHNVFGTQYINGLSISNYNLSGDGSNNSDATISISDGLIYDEDIDANIVHNNSPSNPFEQILYPIAQIPVYYKVGNNGAWTNTTANNYPVKTGTTIQYNLESGGTWSANNSENPSNNRYVAYWICATTQENAPIISIMGQRIDSSLLQAQSNNSWGSLNLTGLPIVELRPLYRLIYDTKNSFSNTPKGFLVDILDIRSHIDTVTGLTQNDHGNLYGLADDDHYQYIHIDNARTIDAIHTFSNGLISDGLISSASGNFDNLTVNNINVSVSGHTHIIDDIVGLTGIVPIISNSGDNRLLTSDGSSSGINAESNLTFDGSNFSVSGRILIDGLIIDNNSISSSNGSGILIYPSGGAIQTDPYGDLRGGGAIDLQSARHSEDQVALGLACSILGGVSNKVDGAYSTIGGGTDNIIGGVTTNTFIGGGWGNHIDSSESVIGGGYGNYIALDGLHSTIGGGSNNNIRAPYSTIPGGWGAKTTYLGELSHAAGFFSIDGDAQHSILTLRGLTTDINTLVLNLSNSYGIEIPENTVWTFSIKLSAVDTTNFDAAWWIFRGGVKRKVYMSTDITSIIGSLIKEFDRDDTFVELNSNNATVAPDLINNTLAINVTGLSERTIRWVAIIDISQVQT